MIRHGLLVLILMLTLTSCATEQRTLLPEILPTSAPPVDCATYFPNGSWQFVHSINFAMEDGGKGHALGLLVLRPDEILCALMTVEGLTLFEAKAKNGEEPEVSRALPPFDNRAFALGLIQDLRTLFLPPQGSLIWGQLTDGMPLCRYSSKTEITDILPKSEGCWTLRTYTRKQDTNKALLYRSITSDSCVSIGTQSIPEILELQGLAPRPYHLTLRLLSAESLSSAN